MACPDTHCCKYVLTAMISHFLANSDDLNPVGNTWDAFALSLAGRFAFQQQEDPNPFNEKRVGQIASTIH